MPSPVRLGESSLLGPLVPHGESIFGFQNYEVPGFFQNRIGSNAQILNFGGSILAVAHQMRRHLRRDGIRTIFTILAAAGDQRVMNIRRQRVSVGLKT